MKWSTIRYLCKEGIKGLWKNRLMAIASVGTIVMSLLILGMSYSIAENITYLMHQLETQLGITAYIAEGAEETVVTKIGSEIKKMPHIIEVSYISKEEALRSFSADQENEALFEDFKEDNPLPASFDIKVESVEYQDDVVKALAVYDVLEVQSFKNETQIFADINQSIQIGSFVIIICFVVISLLLITNTIKLTVYVRRKEINIMKYIGATDTFIRWPFMIEGILIGIIGALIPIGLIQWAYTYATTFITDSFGTFMGGIQLQPVGYIMTGLIPMFLTMGIGIGVIGSAIAIRKHLRV